jgi:hypothetical protein
LLVSPTTCTKYGVTNASPTGWLGSGTRRLKVPVVIFVVVLLHWPWAPGIPSPQTVISVGTSLKRPPPGVQVVAEPPGAIVVVVSGIVQVAVSDPDAGGPDGSGHTPATGPGDGCTFGQTPACGVDGDRFGQTPGTGFDGVRLWQYAGVALDGFGFWQDPGVGLVGFRLWQ